MSECPGQGEQLKTAPGITTTHNAKTYATEEEITRMGKFCFPTDQRARDQFVNNSQLFQRRGFLNSWDSIRFSIWFGIVLGIIYLILVQLFPQIMNWVGVIGGGVASIVLGATILAYRSVYFEGMNVGRGVLGLVLVVVGLYLLISVFLKQRQLRLNGVFLDHASRMVAND